MAWGRGRWRRWRWRAPAARSSQQQGTAQGSAATHGSECSHACTSAHQTRWRAAAVMGPAAGGGLARLHAAPSPAPDSHQPCSCCCQCFWRAKQTPPARTGRPPPKPPASAPPHSTSQRPAPRAASHGRGAPAAPGSEPPLRPPVGARPPGARRLAVHHLHPAPGGGGAAAARRGAGRATGGGSRRSLATRIVVGGGGGRPQRRPPAVRPPPARAGGSGGGGQRAARAGDKGRGAAAGVLDGRAAAVARARLQRHAQAGCARRALPHAGHLSARVAAAAVSGMQCCMVQPRRTMPHVGTPAVQPVPCRPAQFCASCPPHVCVQTWRSRAVASTGTPTLRRGSWRCARWPCPTPSATRALAGCSPPGPAVCAGCACAPAVGGTACHIMRQHPGRPDRQACWL